MPLLGIGTSGWRGATDVLEWTRRLSPKLVPATELEIRSLLEKSYRGARLARAEAEYLSNRGWTLEEFKNHGRDRLPEATYANIDARIALFDLGAELIACGWGPEEEFPSILTVRNPGVCVEHMRLGFWCVGSGATAAQMSVFGRNYPVDMPVEEAVYYVVEAKINAEHAAGVGERTDTFIVWKGEKGPTALSEAENDQIRAVWETLKPRELSDQERKVIGQIAEIKKFKVKKGASK